MKWLICCLLVFLSISISVNLMLWQRLEQPNRPRLIPLSVSDLLNNTENHDDSQRTAYSHSTNRAISGSEEKEQDSEQIDIATARAIFRIKQQIAAGEFGIARQAIQQQLRAQPQNIEYLLLEAYLIKATSNVDQVLAHYYSLLDLPLNTQQRGEVLLTITNLTNDNIEKLKSIRAWDVLATFLEPLWQFDPNRKSIILALAESYARQRQEFLMENVLASLSQHDIEATKIRQIFAAQSSATKLSSNDPQPEKLLQYERAVALTPLGDHFIAPLKLGRRTLNLMIDTGASTTVITGKTFSSLPNTYQRQYIGSFKVNTAGGQVTAPLFQLKQVFLGGFRLDDIAVVVLDMPEFSYADGLLGMNLLRQFDFKIDQQNAELLLNRTAD
ncbi:retropepsin-like aspartic protease [Aliiglaciecola litoralis]|uniref:Peptidase A2 domain-containing protein n=1 Tax=Aliiglaciecola litoralis TaxID=582857 RepID=A0ABP3WZ78_9ALTE